MESFFEWMLESSLLVLMIIGIRKIFIGKIPYAGIYALWAVVLLRFMVPVNFISTPISVANIFSDTYSARDVVELSEQKGEDYEPTGEKKQQNNETGIVWDSHSVGEVSENHQQSDSVQKTDRVQERGTQINSDKEDGTDWQLILKKGWLMVSAILFLWLFLSNLCLLRRMKKNRVLYGQREKVKIYAVSGIKNPCLYGFIRPAIYLPVYLVSDEGSEQKDGDELNFVITHEFVHYRHRDHIWGMLRMLLVSVYWFDPFLWLAASCSKKDAELFCDETTIRLLGEEKRFCYGEMLIRLAGNAGRGDFRYSMVPMSRRGKEMEKRIRAISEKKSYSKYFLIPLAAVLSAVIAITCSAGIGRPSAGEGAASDTVASGMDVSAGQMKEKNVPEADQVVEEQISAYADFLKEHADDDKYGYYSLAWLEDTHVVLVATEFINQIDNGKWGSSEGRIYNLVEGKVAACGKVACSSSGEWIHLSSGKILTDTHHSVTRAWVDPNSDRLMTETAKENLSEPDDGSSEFPAWMKEFDRASSIIFYANPYMGGKDGADNPEAVALHNKMADYAKKIGTNAYKYLEKDITQDGKADTIMADIDKMENTADTEEPSVTVTSGKTKKVIYSIPLNIVWEGYHGIYIYKDGKHTSLMTWNPSISQGKGNYQWKIFDLTEKGEEKILAQDSFSFDLTHPRDDDPEKIQKFVNRLNSYLKKAVFFIGTNNDEVIYSPPAQTYDPSKELEALKGR